MQFQNRVCQEELHEEHAAVQALLQRVEQTIARHRNDLPDAKDPMMGKLMNDLASELPGEVDRHFTFERRSCSPLSRRRAMPHWQHLTHGATSFVRSAPLW